MGRSGWLTRVLLQRPLLNGDNGWQPSGKEFTLAPAALSNPNQKRVIIMLQGGHTRINGL